MREMIECATDKERKQLKAYINVYLGNMLRKRMAEGQQKTELGEDDDDYRDDRNSSI